MKVLLMTALLVESGPLVSAAVAVQVLNFDGAGAGRHFKHSAIDAKASAKKSERRNSVPR